METASQTKIKFQIKNRWTGNILFEYESQTLKETVVKAIKSGANLSDADLRDADLRGAHLRDSDLTDSTLSAPHIHDHDIPAVQLSDQDIPHADPIMIDVY